MEVNIAEMSPFAMRHLLKFLKASPFPKAIAAAVFCLAFCFWGAPVLAQQDDISIFQVNDVVTDVTSDSAAHAREKAVADAQRTAFGQLIDRLGAPASVGTKLSDDDIAALVKSFEVKDEHVSTVRYIGTFAVQFKPNAIRKLLDNRGSNYTETRSPPVVVLPILNTNGHPVLWEDKTKWRMAWESAPHNDGLVPVIIPAGELDDVSLISTAEAMKGKTEAIKALIDKYQSEGVMVATLNADLDKPAGDFKVDLMHYDADGDAMPAAHFTLPAPADKAALDVTLAQAVARVRHQLEKDWRNTEEETTSAPAAGAVIALDAPQAVSHDPVTHLSVQVEIGTLAEWAEIRHKLDNVPSISHTDVITLQRGATSIELEFHGTIDALQEALMQHNLVLQQDATSDMWVLQPLLNNQ
jgi:hypothetical protein